MSAWITSAVTRLSVGVLALGFGTLFAGTALGDTTEPHAQMLRHPDVSATHIAFGYANDIWLVPRAGGSATPLVSPPGVELYPRFSPDGSVIAFRANYDGNQDLYTIPAVGGVPFRVTHHPAGERLCDWTPDGRLIFHASGMGTYPRAVELFTVPATGGLPEKMPVPYGASGAVSADGQWLAYTPHSRDRRTWKRYRGGMATDIWLFHLAEHTSQKITDWEGTDTQPMWHGSKVYYLCDAGPAHRLNIWVYDTQTRQRHQVTKFADYDVKWPSIGPGPSGAGEIVLQQGADLHLLDLATEKLRKVSITIPGELPKVRQQVVDVSNAIRRANISPSGKRAVAEARGDIWTLPAEHGSPRSLTRTNGIHEREPEWSPDGRWIAYFSDQTGEYELYITQSDGKGETRQLTHDGTVFRTLISWSPNSEHILFGDRTGSLYLYTLETEEVKFVDKDPWSTLRQGSWSHDSSWIAYGKDGRNQVTSVWLYNLASGDKHQVTSGMFNDTWPTFDREGDYLFYVSARDFSGPLYEDAGRSFVYTNTNRLMVVPLRADMKSPFAPKSDEEEWDEADGEDDAEDADDADDGDGDDDADDEGDEAEDSGGGEDGADDAADDTADDEDPENAAADDSADDEEDKDGEDKDEESDEEAEEEEEPLEIDLDGFESRAIILPLDRGHFRSLAVNHKGHLLYTRSGRGPGVKTAIKIFDLEDEKREEKNVLADAGHFAITADGKMLLVHKSGKLAVIKAAAGQKMDKTVPTGGMRITIDPRAEWEQMFNEAWRIYRDYFYDPHMHGVDWPAVRALYGQMLADCVSRDDLAFLIREMISELNVGHAYYMHGDYESGPSVNVGMLGCDFELADGAYRIRKLYTGGPFDADARGPLSQPGVEAKVGDFLLAVNDIKLDPAEDPWAAFVGLANQVVTLTVADSPESEEPRDLVVKLLSSEDNLRYRAWVEANRRHVAESTAGKVGYIYVPDTGGGGQNELFRQFYGQIDKAALIIDERWNGGGQIPHRFVELLNRPVVNYWAQRDSYDAPSPGDAHQGPKCMLINGLAGSGGDAFPAYFRNAGLGKLIGTRTWGGLVGISGNPGLLDGTYLTVPRFAYYDLDGTWGIEGHGVDPDQEVVDDPALMVDGSDPQLEAAIGLMLDEIKRSPYTPPTRPAYPDRSGMGIPEADK